MPGPREDDSNAAMSSNQRASERPTSTVSDDEHAQIRPRQRHVEPKSSSPRPHSPGRVPDGGDPITALRVLVEEVRRDAPRVTDDVEGPA